MDDGGVIAPGVFRDHAPTQSAGLAGITDKQAELDLAQLGQGFGEAYGVGTCADLLVGQMSDVENDLELAGRFEAGCMGGQGSV